MGEEIGQLERQSCNSEKNGNIYSELIAEKFDGYSNKFEEYSKKFSPDTTDRITPDKLPEDLGLKEVNKA